MPVIKKRTASLVCLMIFACAPALTYAGPNAAVGCALDMDLNTRNYTDTISLAEIELNAEAAVGEEFFLVVVAQNVSNLDTYNIDVNFDSEILAYIEGYKGNPLGGIVNILEKNGGNAPGFPSQWKKLWEPSISPILSRWTTRTRLPKALGWRQF